MKLFLIAYIGVAIFAFFLYRKTRLVEAPEGKNPETVLQKAFFTIIFIMLILIWIPYPGAFITTIMYLATPASNDENFLDLLRRMFLYIFLVYPFAFFFLFFIGRKMVLKDNKGLGYFLAVLPIIFVFAFFLFLIIGMRG
ncbi:MAG TPA: hypothetical protein PKK13_01765 [Spirochaetota bacterium]|jgi:hypothetical protein|nr:MAG: hypothetical protein BWX91_00264 [Spirochaetes bacterium ADurb.Bin133]HNZ25938.1 hypothetical protein [Spirochaetota bacterium]